MKRMIRNLIKKSFMLSKIKLFIFKKKWRTNNKHNKTQAKNCFNINKVKVGKYTYGELDVHHFGNQNEQLIIGSWCSIAPECKFLLGGEHRYDCVTTFPFQTFSGQKESESFTRGPIIIGDDVWIGYGAMVLSGVKIGQGAVVGAGAVVVEDVPPYTIVGGVPAKEIKKRFSTDVIECLMEIDYGKLSMEDAIELKQFLSVKLDEKNVGRIVKAIVKRGEIL